MYLCIYIYIPIHIYIYIYIYVGTSQPNSINYVISINCYKNTQKLLKRHIYKLLDYYSGSHGSDLK